MSVDDLYTSIASGRNYNECQDWCYSFYCILLLSQGTSRLYIANITACVLNFTPSQTITRKDL